jgi:hypothetical protein
MANEFIARNGLIAQNNSVITGSLEITGSQVYLKTNGFIVENVDLNASLIEATTSGGVYVWSTNTNPSADFENRYLVDSTAINSIDWQNRQLFDTAGNLSIDWNGRQLTDASNTTIISYDPANGQQRTNQFSYHNYYTVNETQGESLIQYAAETAASNFAGETLGFGANIDPAILSGELCSLGEDGVWNITDQTNISSSAMLGICVEPWNKSVMLTEGTITVVTASGYTDIPFVEGTSFHGKPVYIRSGSLGGLTTTKPTSGYIRIVGHMYYNSTTYTDYWLMKFRPSNDWYQI